MNRVTFYKKAKLNGLFPMLTQSQVDSINTLLDQCEGLPKQYTAYIFATVKHETANTFLPIEERGNNSYLSKYWNNTRLRKWLGNIGLSDSWLFKGRGYCQITGRANYHKVGSLLGIDLIKHPEKTLEPKIAAKIIVEGMLHGWFTGRKLSHYFDEGVFDGYTARKIINGLDQAEHIQWLYNRFLQCIED
jgi:putative chitinase